MLTSWDWRGSVVFRAYVSLLCRYASISSFLHHIPVWEHRECWWEPEQIWLNESGRTVLELIDGFRWTIAPPPPRPILVLSQTPPPPARRHACCLHLRQTCRQPRMSDAVWRSIGCSRWRRVSPDPVLVFQALVGGLPLLPSCQPFFSSVRSIIRWFRVLLSG